MNQDKKVTLLTHYLLCFLFLLTLSMHLFNIHVIEILPKSITSLTVLSISTLYAVLGGMHQLRDNMKKLSQYIIGILTVIAIALAFYAFDKDILMVVAFLGFLLGFYDFKLATR